jgi:thiol-disulfide isomerase/thioredoxin
MRSWAAGALAGGRRGHVLRVAAAVALAVGLVWVLPVRRAGEEGGHHARHAAPELDAFERAGVTELRAGHPTPPLRLPRLDGGVAGLEDHRDKLVVVNFWATWCEPCTAEMPTLEALWREYRERGLVVLGVSADRGADLKASQAWRVSGLPATFLVRPGGEATGMAFGAREWDSAEMRALIESLLPHHH